MFKSVQMYFIFRIAFFLLLGITSYVFFGLQQSTILPDFPNLWEVLITAFGGTCLAIASYYFSRYRLLGRIDEFLMGEVDKACNALIDADDPGKLKPNGNIYTPKLLVEQVGEFGKSILQTLCSNEIFHYAEGGVFCIKDPILPQHPRTVYPDALRDNIGSVFFNFIDLYLRDHPEDTVLFRTDKMKTIKNLTDEAGKSISLYDENLHNMLKKGIRLPSRNAILTPIFLKKEILAIYCFFTGRNLVFHD